MVRIAVDSWNFSSFIYTAIAGSRDKLRTRRQSTFGAAESPEFDTEDSLFSYDLQTACAHASAFWENYTTWKCITPGPAGLRTRTEWPAARLAGLSPGKPLAEVFPIAFSEPEVDISAEIPIFQVSWQCHYGQLRT
jgi:hypothetical protein